MEIMILDAPETNNERRMRHKKEFQFWAALVSIIAVVLILVKEASCYGFILS